MARAGRRGRNEEGNGKRGVGSERGGGNRDRGEKRIPLVVYVSAYWDAYEWDSAD